MKILKNTNEARRNTGITLIALVITNIVASFAFVA